MADYWKSQPRKFCELCKCWMADNKPSVDFHERGKRHQESVKRRLDDMRKKGIEEAKRDREEKSYLAEMEREALKKFKEDLVQNPLLAAGYGINASSIKVSSGHSLGLKTDLSANQHQQKKLSDNNKTSRKKKGEAIYPQPNPNATPEETVPPTANGEWQEVNTEDGHLYYWNCQTGESSWFLPGTSEYDDYIKQIASMPAGEAAAYFQQSYQQTTTPGEMPIYPVLADSSITLPSASTEIKHEPSDYFANYQTWDCNAQPPSSLHDVKQENSNVKTEVKEESKEEMTTINIKMEDNTEIYPMFQERKRKRDDTSIYGQWEEVKPASEATNIDYQLPECKKLKTKTIVVPKEEKPVIKEKVAPISNSNKPLVDFKKRSKDDKPQTRSRNFRQRDDDEL